MTPKSDAMLLIWEDVKDRREHQQNIIDSYNTAIDILEKANQVVEKHLGN